MSRILRVLAPVARTAVLAQPLADAYAMCERRGLDVESCEHVETVETVTMVDGTVIDLAAIDMVGIIYDMHVRD